MILNVGERKMIMKKVIIIGAGGHGKSIADIVLKSRDELLGFLDDNILVGTTIIKSSDTRVIGTTSDCTKFADAEFIIAFGDNKTRRDFASKHHLNYYTAIHPSSNIAADVIIGRGTAIMANSSINTSATIGEHCIINTGAIVEHDNVINDFVHISPAAALAGNVTVGKCTHIGIGATVKNNISISEDITIGAGAVVVKNIAEIGGVYVGVPAVKKE